KTTRNSDSVLHLSPGTPRARIQVARLGSVFVFLRQSDAGPWIVHQRYVRPDLPATLQVGLTTYTDWNSASRLQPLVHNQTVIRDGNPDLVAVFDYVRFARPSIPETLRGRDFADPASVSDAELVAFLGPRANLPGGAIHPPGLTVGRGEPVGKIELRVGNLRSERSYRIEASEERNDWLTVETFVADGESRSFVVDTGHGGRFFRVASP
ncbi:MAG: hypothetical protein JNL97_16850, partial [Verrucomicrobiales bacterium]|nr:hypothetical protein [Verrucomicrobiales bacterium]